MKPKSRILAITGNIATGKSLISQIVSDEYGFQKINADTIGHEMLLIPKIRNRIIRHFGPDILKNGEIDRKTLGNIVFSERSQLETLNSIVHPALIAEADARIKHAIKEGFHVVFEAAILFEAAIEERFEHILLTVCHPEEQIKRLVERNNITKEAALKIINSQIPQIEKIKKAEYIVDTTFGPLSFKKNLELTIRDFLEK